MSHLSALIHEWHAAQAAKSLAPPRGVNEDAWIDSLLDRLELSGSTIAATRAVDLDGVAQKLEIALVRIAEDQADGLIRNEIHQALIDSAIDDLRFLDRAPTH